MKVTHKIYIRPKALNNISFGDLLHNGPDGLYEAIGNSGVLLKEDKKVWWGEPSFSVEADFSWEEVRFNYIGRYYYKRNNR